MYLPLIICTHVQYSSDLFSTQLAGKCTQLAGVIMPCGVGNTSPNALILFWYGFIFWSFRNIGLWLIKLVWKGLTSWLSSWVCYFPIGILGQVWNLIVSIPDLSLFSFIGGRGRGNWRTFHYYSFMKRLISVSFFNFVGSVYFSRVFFQDYLLLTMYVTVL